VEKYPRADDLETIAKALLDFGPGQNYRPVEVEIRACGKRLKWYMERNGKFPDNGYSYIGTLIKTAFSPTYWNPADDAGQAIKKLLERADQGSSVIKRKTSKRPRTRKRKPPTGSR
jgi:hypothetical protein